MAGRLRGSWLAGLLLLAGIWQLGQGAYIPLKAALAQQLLQWAWQRAEEGKDRPKPWSWADTWPLARLQVERLAVDQIVLAGASGRTLAFGPGHLTGTAPPGTRGNSVISGHRDTHFRFIRHLRQGDRIRLVLPDGEVRLYRITERSVRNERDLSVLAPLSVDRLTLVTCYPFTTLVPGGPLRFVVVAERD